MNKKYKHPARQTAGLIVSSLLFALSITLFGVCVWMDNTFEINFQQLLYTLASPLEGSDMGLVRTCLSWCTPYLLLAALFIFFGAAVYWLQTRIQVYISFRLWKRRRQLDLLKLSRRCLAVLSVASLLVFLWYADHTLHILEYMQLRKNPTTIYEDNYVDPLSVAVTAPQEKKNLIYIYMESMETTYASEAVGGKQPEINYIPNLTTLAQENCSFSNSDRLGGFRSCYGTTWTMGSLFATTSGLPFSFPIEANSLDNFQIVAPGCTTLGDILEENGYHNVFLCGSDGDFAGRKKYFQQHGNYDVYDLYTAWDEGYVPKGLAVFWGYEDEVLYRIAKDKVLELAEGDQPFNFTMLTVDTHHVGGYVCSLCENKYASGLGNVIDCADRQIADFIQWCQEQDFYKDTVIVITGDHPRMDELLVDHVEYQDRTVYNAFLNCPVSEDTRTTFREFTAVDIFPTVLSSLGFDIEGNQLGLGVNLFSGKDTLSEQLGFDYLNLEFAKYSPYFEEQFA